MWRERNGKLRFYFVRRILFGKNFNSPTALDGIPRVHHFCDHMLNGHGVSYPLHLFDALGHVTGALGVCIGAPQRSVWGKEGPWRSEV
jgi:hypothetical protein